MFTAVRIHIITRTFIYNKTIVNVSITTIAEQHKGIIPPELSGTRNC